MNDDNVVHDYEPTTVKNEKNTLPSARDAVKYHRERLSTTLTLPRNECSHSSDFHRFSHPSAAFMHGCVDKVKKKMR